MATVVVIRFFWPDSFSSEDAETETVDRLSKAFAREMFEVEDVELET
jgi:hypothetical protein